MIPDHFSLYDAMPNWLHGLSICIFNNEAMGDMMDIQYNRTIKTLERLRAESTAAGGPEKINRQHSQSKLTARERIDLLLDEGSFEEFDVLKTGRSSSLGGDRLYLGDGVITGHGNIDGREVFVFSQDFTVIGGSLGEAHSQKICKVMDMAVKVGLPLSD